MDRLGAITERSLARAIIDVPDERIRQRLQSQLQKQDRPQRGAPHPECDLRIQIHEIRSAALSNEWATTTTQRLPSAQIYISPRKTPAKPAMTAFAGPSDRCNEPKTTPVVAIAPCNAFGPAPNALACGFEGSLSWTALERVLFPIGNMTNLLITSGHFLCMEEKRF